MKDQRSKDAVQAAIDYGNGLITDEQLRIASFAAAFASTFSYATSYADDVAADAALYAADSYSVFSATAAASASASAFASADSQNARIENQQKTADIVRSIIKTLK